MQSYIIFCLSFAIFYLIRYSIPMTNLFEQKCLELGQESRDYLKPIYFNLVMFLMAILIAPLFSVVVLLNREELLETSTDNLLKKHGLI